MNKFVSMMVALVVTLFTINSFAWDPPHTPKPQSAILDQANVLTQDARNRLDAQLKQINGSTANEIAVLILPDLAGESIEDVGIHTAKAWGVGKKDVDNGVLIVLAMKEHKSRIEVGKGAEGDLPDLKANDILKNVLRPHMKNGDVEGGLSATISAVSSTIANHKADVAAGRATTPSTSTPANNGALCDVSPEGVGTSSQGFDGMALFIIALFGVVGFLVVRSIQRNKAESRRLQEIQEFAFEEEERRKQAAVTRRDRLVREAELKKPTPVVVVPEVPRRTYVPPTPVPVVHSAPVVHSHADSSTETLAAVSTAAEVLELSRQREEEARERREAAQREEDRRRRERDEEDARRRREREDEDRRRSESSSSSSSSSSYDSGSSGGGYDSGGGFGGGDFGGGGSSGDW